MMKKATCAILSCLLGMAVATGPAAAYPEKPINVVCPSAPGAVIDTLTRFIDKVAQKYIQEPIRVTTKKGGGGAVAMTFVKGQKADGYTVLACTRSTFVRMLLPNSCSLDDFIPVAMMQAEPYGLSVRADSPFKNLGELVDYAKKNPGKLSCAAFTFGGTSHLVLVNYEKKLGIKTNYVPFDGGNDQVTALLGGKVDSHACNLGQSIPLHKNGSIRILAVTADKRLAALPDVPTFKELGYPIVDKQYKGYAVSSKTPASRVKELEELFRKIANDKEFQDFSATLGGDPFYTDVQASKALFQKDAEALGPVLRELGLLK